MGRSFQRGALKASVWSLGVPVPLKTFSIEFIWHWKTPVMDIKEFTGQMTMQKKIVFSMAFKAH
jgi:hypothetical protein